MTDTQHEADTLARFLDGDGSLNGRVTEETRALASLAHRLQGAAARPEPGRRGELRAELLEAARAHQPSPPLRTRVRGWLEGAQPRRPRVPAMPRLAAASRAAAATRTAAVPRLAALVGAAIIAVSGSGLAYGAETALPGDTLYSVKLAVEDVRLAFEGDRSARGTMYLSRAAERIGEAEASAASGNDAGAALALRHANDSARAGAGAILFSHRTEEDPQLIDRLARFTSTQSGRLTTLATGLRGEAADAAASTLVSFERIQAQATALGGFCPRCDEPTPASESGSEPGGRETPTRTGAEAGEPADRHDAERASPDATEPATSPQELDPRQPREAAPDTTPPGQAEDPSSSMPGPWDPDAWNAEAWDAEEPWDADSWDADDAPIDPPDRDGAPKRKGLFPDRDATDLPF